MKKEKNANLITFALSWVGRKNKKLLDKAAKILYDIVRKSRKRWISSVGRAPDS